MDTALVNGDFQLMNGKPQRVVGIDELLQRASIRLTVPLGAFPIDPALGSRLQELSALSGGQTEKALVFAKESLRRLPQIAVERAEYSENPPFVTVTVNSGGETREIEVKIHG